MRAKETSNKLVELKALRELSGRLGRNRLLVQACSGNTSIKIGGVMWIKASGKWLIQAETADFLVPVQLARARTCLKEKMAIPETERNSCGPVCASIETAMHAALPQKVVVHVHSVNAVAWAVREDAPRQLEKRLSGLDWQWIPYIRSGADLASKVQQVLARLPRTNVLVLGNHGLVVCGDSCDSAERMLAEVESCLAAEPRSTPDDHSTLSDRLIAGSGWSLADWASVQALATDPISRRILSGGVLYPCQAIFLPWTVGAVERSLLRAAILLSATKTTSQ